jgi:hypothetical protein
MTKRIAVAIIGAAGLLSGCNVSQPTPGCIVQDGEWQAKYTLKSTELANQACGALKGEAFGVYKFTDPKKAGSTILAIRPEGAAALIVHHYETTTTDSSGKEVTEDVSFRRVEDATSATSISAFAEEPDAQSFCAGTSVKPAQVDAPVVYDKYQTTKEVAAATSVNYTFDKVEVYSDPAAPGTQLRAELSYTEGGCTAKYDVVAMWPIVHCTPGSDKPAESCGAGSGINPDFAVQCDAELEVCVPSKPIPSLISSN